MKLKQILWVLLCLGGTVPGFSQETRKEIAGRVLDSLGAPLPNASVANLKSGAKVLTGNEGQFTIAAQSTETIEISHIGYQTVRLTSFNGGDISLIQDQSSLEDVVVVGFATQKKKDLTGAIDHISGAKLAERPISNVFQGLQGVSPGLNITYNGGQPGSTPQLNIRGFASINDNNGSPLIIIDGIAATTDDLLRINAADIASISVLRDASSAAIYGARAAFGVLLLTTKQGGKQKQNISYNNYLAWSKRTVLPEPVTDPYIYMKVLETSTNNTPWDYVNYESWQYDWAKQRSDDPSSAPESMVNPNDPSRWAYMGNNNLNDYFFNKASLSQYHTLSFSGAATNAGKRPISYFLSADYTKENGLIAIARDDWKRYGLRGKLDFSPLSWLKISNNLNVYQLERNQPTYNVTDVYYTQPTDVVKNPDGTWGNNTAGYLASRLVDGGRNVQTRFGFQNILRGVATFLNGDLQLTGDASFKRELWNYSAQYLPYNIGYGPNDVRAEGGTSSVAETNATVKQYVYDLYANYNKQLGDHGIKVTAGYSQEEYEWDPVYVSRANLISSSVPYIGLATGDMQVNTTSYGGYYSYAIRSLFGRINYSYKNRYILEANGRMDGSSRFPPADRWGFFPSLSGAWIVSEENFWKPVSPVISSLKLRASHGWLGNQSVAYYGYIQSLNVSQSPYLINGTRPNVLGAAPSLQVDPNNYTWEKVGTSNLGFDIGFLDNKITAGFDYFVRNTTGMLAPSQELPAVLGTSAPRQNAADLQTKGWELSVGYTNTFNLSSKPFQLNVKAIMSDSKSKITRYDNQSKTFSAAFYEGQTLGEVWGLTNDGMFKNQEEINSLDQSAIVPWGALEIVPGWPKYMDFNKDNKIELGTSALEPKDLKIIGNTSPRYRVGFNLNMNWNNFDLSLFLQGVLKQDFYPHHYLYWGPYQQPYANVYPWNLDFYRGTAESDADRANNSNSYNAAGLADANTDSHFPVMQAWLADNNYGSGLDIPQTQYMLNASYLRVKNLTLGYSLPGELTRKLHVNRLRLFFSGENLYEFSSIKQYMDPEAVSDGYGWEYPYQRKYSFGINLDF